MQKKPSHVKHYLKSKTPESLKQKMAMNNVERKHYFDYQIMFDGVNWFAWYEWDTESLFVNGELDENDD